MELDVDRLNDAIIEYDKYNKIGMWEDYMLSNVRKYIIYLQHEKPDLIEDDNDTGPVDPLDLDVELPEHSLPDPEDL